MKMKAGKMTLNYNPVSEVKLGRLHAVLSTSEKHNYIIVVRARALCHYSKINVICNMHKSHVMYIRYFIVVIIRSHRHAVL